MTASSNYIVSGYPNPRILNTVGLYNGTGDNPALSLDFTSGVLDPRITFTRADATTCATRYNASGLLETVAANVPRFDYDPITLTAKGLLIEETRQNAITYSGQFENAAWERTEVDVAANATTAPDGTLTAALVTDTTVSSLHYIQTGLLSNTNQTYTQSVFAKAGTAGLFRFTVLATGSGTTTSTVVFTQTAGVFSAGAVAGLITEANAVNVGNGWYRCSITYTLVGTVTAHKMRLFIQGTGTYVGTGIGTYFWGGQVEVGAFPTSYIPTAASAVTRAADKAWMTGTGFSDWYNPNEGTFVCGAVNQFVTGTAAKNFLSITTSTLTDRINLSIGTTSKPQYYLQSGGVTQVNNIGNTFNSLVANVPFKAVATYKLNDFAFSVDGQVPITDTVGVTPVGVDQARIGGISTTNSVFNGHISSVSYYNTRLTDTQLQSLTV